MSGAIPYPTETLLETSRAICAAEASAVRISGQIERRYDTRPTVCFARSLRASLTASARRLVNQAGLFRACDSDRGRGLLTASEAEALAKLELVLAARSILAHAIIRAESWQRRREVAA